ARHAALAKKVSRAEHCDYRFFSGPIYHREFHATLLDVHDGIRSLTLRVNRFAPSKLCNFSRNSCGIEEDLRIECSASSILLYFSWSHIRVGMPSLHGCSTALSTLARRVLLEL